MFDLDQAAGLRQLFARSRPEVILACGGSPDQAHVAVALGRGMAAQGRQVLIIDGSAGDIPRAMGLAARYELGHVATGDKPLARVLLEGSARLRILPALRGLDALWRLDSEHALRLKTQFAAHLAQVETLIVNCPPLGSLAAARAFRDGAHLIVVVGEHTDCVTLAYREIKALWLDLEIRHCDVIVSHPSARARENFETLAQTAQHFLGVTLHLQGLLPQSRTRPRAPDPALRHRWDQPHFSDAQGGPRWLTRDAFDHHGINQEQAHAAIG